ncbi:hypothetical protein A4G19_15100 [Pasteurellaceae bacterium Macca]|nr:hypothetical protein [Pasteurellaceae bacterium Macca]
MNKQKGSITYAHQRGEIQESAIKALVTDKLFRPRIERNKKGKGSYQRRGKHVKAESPFKNICMKWF